MKVRSSQLLPVAFDTIPELSSVLISDGVGRQGNTSYTPLGIFFPLCGINIL